MVAVCVARAKGLWNMDVKGSSASYGTGQHDDEGEKVSHTSKHASGWREETQVDREQSRIKALIT